jgi:hypothetical protein
LRRDAPFTSIFPPWRFSREEPSVALLQARSALIGRSANPRHFSSGEARFSGEAPTLGTSLPDRRDAREKRQGLALLQARSACFSALLLALIPRSANTRWGEAPRGRSVN